MEFIKEITEARMTRDSSNQRVLTYTDCCERTYLSLLALEFMRNFPSYTSFVQDYCKKSRHHNYQHFKISGTDEVNHQKISYSEWCKDMKFTFSFLNKDFDKTILKLNQVFSLI